MLQLREPASTGTGMTFHQMLESVRYHGAYSTSQQAEAVTRAVLESLGRRLAGDERVELAACLPTEAAHAFTSQIPEPQPLTGWGFVRDLAARTGTTPAVARWDTGAVLSVVGHLAGPDLLDHSSQAIHTAPPRPGSEAAHERRSGDAAAGALPSSRRPRPGEADDREGCVVAAGQKFPGRAS